MGSNGQTNVPAEAAGGQIALAAGGDTTCALSAAGGVTCWGNWPTVPAAAATGGQVAVAVGSFHMCALSAAGAVSCWGLNTALVGQSSVPTAAQSGQVAVSAGDTHTCSVSAAGGVNCWGRSGIGQSAVPVAAVAAGNGHTCALSAAGGVSCWGDNSFGQTTVPAAFTFVSTALPCHPSTLLVPTPSPSAAPTPGLACTAVLFRALPGVDLVGTRLGAAAADAAPGGGAPAWMHSEEACRIACCATAGCTGYSYTLYDTARRWLAVPSPCFLLANVTQLVPSNTMASGVLLSSLL